jgi:hypothetical protein
VQAMAWWLVPITATLLAVAWVTWSARPRRPADPHDTLAAHRRFTEALSPTTPDGTEVETRTENDPDAAASSDSREHRRSA